jgi:hypothetical protein
LVQQVAPGLAQRFRFGGSLLTQLWQALFYFASSVGTSARTHDSMLQRGSATVHWLLSETDL